ncbi:hypothetical protein MUK42_20713 [Musa troglodytarum]|nr:hypothetical protein MUK42_20713 [Musa troglodytarum]
MEMLSLIDASSEDNLLTSPHCGDPNDQSSSGGLMCLFLTFDCFIIVRNASCVLEFPFTAVVGVLNHEELATLNSTFKKTEAYSLPTIPEDARRKAESNSTLDNDSWALENLEVDLFENVRACKQKALVNGEKALSLLHSSKKNNPVKEDAQPHGSSVKFEPFSHVKNKSHMPSERQGVNRHLHKHNSGGATVVTNVAADRTTHSKTLSKPTRVVSGATMPSMPAKTRFFPENTQIRTSNMKDKPGNVLMHKSSIVSKKINESPSSGNPKSFQSSKSALKLVSNSSDKEKAPLKMTGMTSTSRTISCPSSSGSVIKKASTRTGGIIIRRNASDPAIFPDSTVKLSSSTSPSSSFDSVAAGSSSPTLFASEVSSSSPLLEGTDNDKVCSPGLKSCQNFKYGGNQLCRLHSTGSSSYDELTSEASRRNHPRSFTNKSSETKCYGSSAKKTLTSQTSNKQPNFLKATFGTSKTDSVNKVKPSKIQDSTLATQNKTITSDSRQTQSTAPWSPRTSCLDRNTTIRQNGPPAVQENRSLKNRPLFVRGGSLISPNEAVSRRQRGRAGRNPYSPSLRIAVMAKEFSVPPVVFPSSLGNPNVPQQRRAPGAAPFQPPRPSNPGPANPSLPFMSFDVGSAPASSSSAPVFAPAAGGGFSVSGSFEDVPPLLEELGINTRQIWRKTISILNPFRVNPNLHEDADLSGPFLFLMAFGLFQLLAGKFHFGIILGWVTVAALFLYIVFNMLAGRNGNLDLYRCLSLIGYCMLPMVIFSALSLFVLHGGVVIFLMAAVFVLWSTRVCTALLVELASCGDEHRGLIAYACWLETALKKELRNVYRVWLVYTD